MLAVCVLTASSVVWLWIRSLIAASVFYAVSQVTQYYKRIQSDRQIFRGCFRRPFLSGESDGNCRGFIPCLQNIKKWQDFENSANSLAEFAAGLRTVIR